MPGEKAYISESTILEGVTNPDDYKETTFNFEFDQTDKKPNLMEVQNTKGIKGDEYTPYKITGVVKNTTDEVQKDTRIAAALFDENGKLLGVLNGSVDVTINPGSEAAFELSYPDLPPGFSEKVKSFDVKAFGWTW